MTSFDQDSGYDKAAMQKLSAVRPEWHCPICGAPNCVGGCIPKREVRIPMDTPVECVVNRWTDRCVKCGRNRAQREEFGPICPWQPQPSVACPQCGFPKTDGEMHQIPGALTGTFCQHTRPSQPSVTGRLEVMSEQAGHYVTTVGKWLVTGSGNPDSIRAIGREDADSSAERQQPSKLHNEGSSPSSPSNFPADLSIDEKGQLTSDPKCSTCGFDLRWETADQFWPAWEKDFRGVCVEFEDYMDFAESYARDRKRICPECDLKKA